MGAKKTFKWVLELGGNYQCVKGITYAKFDGFLQPRKPIIRALRLGYSCKGRTLRLRDKTQANFVARELKRQLGLEVAVIAVHNDGWVQRF